MKKFDVICFDLDGTLVEMNPLFKVPLFAAGFVRFAPIIPPWKFYQTFWKAVRGILQNEGQQTNFDVFVQGLATGSFQRSPSQIEKIINDLLYKDFPKLKPFFYPVTDAQNTVQLAKQLGYRLILATNPVFPQKAVETRLEGGGFSPKDFSIITHAQNMGHCKPKVGYYRELIDKFALDPSRCLMVGNDLRKDLPAHDVGMQTFILLTDKNRKTIASKLSDSRINYHGDQQQLQKLLQDNQVGTL